MARAIAVLTLIVVCSVAFVLLMLTRQTPAAPSARRTGASPPLEMREDGTLYSVGLQVSRLEDRIVDQEKRAVKVQEDLGTVRKERDTLAGQVASLQEEVRRLRRQISEPRPVTPAPITNAPPANVPTNAPVTPVIPPPEGGIP